MVERMPSGQRLKLRWRSQGLKLPNGTTLAEICRFESRYSVNLPSDFRDYLLHMNGMDEYPPDSHDRDGFSFWALGRIRTVAEESTSHQSGRDWGSFPGADSLFIFADYLDWSWAYAIRLSAGDSERSLVYFIGMQDPVVIADSFTDFVDLYLVDSPIIYGPPR